MSLESQRAPTLQSVEGYQLQAAGYAWDAVCVPVDIGMWALAILGERTGAVIVDPHGSVLYWFVDRGVASNWDIPTTRALSLNQHLVVPQRDRVRGPGPHWRRRPLDTALITDATALRTALGTAIAARRAERGEATATGPVNR